MVFGSGAASRDVLEMVSLIDTYVQRADPSWGELLARASLAGLECGPEPAGAFGRRPPDAAVERRAALAFR